MLPGGSLYQHIIAILNDFDPIQVRYAGTDFLKLVDVVTRGAIQTQDYLPAIVVLHTVILRLDPTSSTLTSTHYHFLYMCLQARAFQEAASIIDKPIYHIPYQTEKHAASRLLLFICSRDAPSSAYITPSSGLTTRFSSRGYLEYYTYAGLVYVGLRQWEKAMEMFEVVLSAPSTNTTSMFQVEAYKKWLLVGLIHTGETPKAPKGANTSIMKSVKAISKPYDCLAEAFQTKDPVRFQAEVNEGTQFWREDLNIGLMRAVMDSFRKFAVIRLGKTFTAISLAEVAIRTSPNPTDLNETVNYISFLISNAQLDATLRMPDHNEPDTIPTLRFLPTSSSTKTEATVNRELVAQTLELRALLKHISDNDEKLEVTKEYIEMLKRLKKAKEAKMTGGAPGASAEDQIDEDMMADM